jgi:hypothetical protein
MQSAAIDYAAQLVAGAIMRAAQEDGGSGPFAPLGQGASSFIRR